MRSVVRYLYIPIDILSTHHLCQRNLNCATGQSLPSKVPFEQGTVINVQSCMSKSGRTLCNVLCGVVGWNHHSTTTTHPSTPLSSLKSNTSRKSTKRSHRPSTKQTLTSTRVAWKRREPTPSKVLSSSRTRWPYTSAIVAEIGIVATNLCLMYRAPLGQVDATRTRSRIWSEDEVKMGWLLQRKRGMWRTSRSWNCPNGVLKGEFMGRQEWKGHWANSHRRRMFSSSAFDSWTEVKGLRWWKGEWEFPGPDERELNARKGDR